MTTNLSLITTGVTEIKPFAVSPEAIRQKEAILADCALIGRVTNADENAACIKAMERLQGLSGQLERDRKRVKEPIINAGRQLDTAVKKETDELDREKGRLSVLAADFARDEQRRISEEKAQAEKLGESPEALAAIQPSRQTGQTTRKVWVIKQINDFQLLKARPDLVRKIEWDMVAIKDLLNQGVKLPGVTAEEDLRVGVRGKTGALVDV